MLTDTRLAFVGSGAMAEAMIKGILAHKLLESKHIIASGPRADRGQELRGRYGVRTTSDNCAAVQDSSILVLSVKPQILPHVLAELQGRLDPAVLVLSIVAGQRIKVIREGLGVEAIVRAMPNTPAQVGEGMTVWTATEAVSDQRCRQAQVMLSALGRELRVEDEGYLDMATALSGTGPAYVFLFMEALIDAGVHMGFRGGWPRSWCCRPYRDRSPWRARPACIRPSCATGSRRPAARLPRRCTSWKRVRCAPSYRRPSGPPIKSQSS